MYYGVDSGTSAFPTSAPSKDFYIGRIGDGETGNLGFYNKTAANLATYKYAYWFIYGPTIDSKYSSSYTANDAIDYGRRQGIAALNEYLAVKSTLGLKDTLFVDAEWDYSSSNPSGLRHGWLLQSENSNAYTFNYAVYKGFMSYINLTTLYSGCYTSAIWTDIMGTANSPNYGTDFFWFAGNYTSSFNTIPTSMSNAKVISGITPTIWQYYGSQTQDGDIASTLPF